MKYALVTGNGGLGSALSKGYLEQGWTVFCCSRTVGSPSFMALKEEYSDRAIEVMMDVGQTNSVQLALEHIRSISSRLDLVINNAAILPGDSRMPLEKVDIDNFLNTININAIGALRVAQVSLPLLRESSMPVFVNISSAGGSLTHIFELDDCTDDYPYAYCMSKAALNMGSAILQRYCKLDKIKVLCIHPGVMLTQMNAHKTPAEQANMILPDVSAKGIMELIQQQKDQIDGPFFFDYTGAMFPY